MKRLFLLLVTALVFAGAVQANTGGIAWDRVPDKSSDVTALQNGAKLFVNYCLNCHSAAYMRYNRLRDIGLTEQQIKDNLLFTTEKVGDLMVATVDPKQAKAWFGAIPPDLSVIARSRSAAGQGSGGDYLYTYLRTFYVDSTKATGWNNLAFPNVGMPHALWELQGKRAPILEKAVVDGQETHVFKGWEQIAPGTMTTAQYDDAVADLVNYLQWMAEPAQHTRFRLGIGVLLFLAVLTFFSWRLNSAYWKDIK
jgi:ubiquinol-cytochrome c reductase cytochrome c1 subunit